MTKTIKEIRKDVKKTKEKYMVLRKTSKDPDHFNSLIMGLNVLEEYLNGHRELPCLYCNKKEE